MKYGKMDLTGKKFDRLTVIERAENSKAGRIRWKCKCDCGNEIIVISTKLLTGSKKSCGCLKADNGKNIKDLTGKKFGRLTVIERAEIKKGGRICWKCKCD
jgi:hypothetical protein